MTDNKLELIIKYANLKSSLNQIDKEDKKAIMLITEGIQMLEKKIQADIDADIARKEAIKLDSEERKREAGRA